MLTGTSLVTVAALRFELFEGRPLKKQLALASVVALAAVFLQLGALRSFGGAWSLLVFGTALFSLLLVLGLRELSRSRDEEKRRLEQHAVLGRFAAQMAHDLKNPLAALIGAAQFLEVKLRDRDGEETKISGLLLEQAQRVNAIIEGYERWRASSRCRAWSTSTSSSKGSLRCRTLPRLRPSRSSSRLRRIYRESRRILI
jgi:signal transduction histidine kinase